MNGNYLNTTITGTSSESTGRWLESRGIRLAVASAQSGAAIRVEMSDAFGASYEARKAFIGTGTAGVVPFVPGVSFQHVSAPETGADSQRDVGGTWTEVTKLLASDGGLGAAFGSVVGVDGEGFVVGAVNRQTAYVYSGVIGVRIEGQQPSSPHEFSLCQNYPNPFNPTTTISYDLPRLSEATLTVYDVLGRQVSVLASGTKPAGTYEVSFDASGLPSGIYFYRLEAGDYVETKRMVIVK